MSSGLAIRGVASPQPLDHDSQELTQPYSPTGLISPVAPLAPLTRSVSTSAQGALSRQSCCYTPLKTISEINPRRVKLDKNVLIAFDSSSDRPLLTRSASELMQTIADWIKRTRRLFMLQVDNVTLTSAKRRKVEEKPKPWVIEFEDQQTLELTDFQRNFLMRHSRFFQTLWTGSFNEAEKKTIRIEERGREDIQRAVNLLQNRAALEAYSFAEIDQLAELLVIASYFQFGSLEEILQQKSMKLIQAHHDKFPLEAFEKAIKLHQFAKMSGYNHWKDELEFLLARYLKDTLNDTEDTGKSAFIAGVDAMRQLNIENMDLSSSLIHDTLLKYVCESLPTIQRLDISSCQHLTPNCLDSLPLLPSLQQLNLSFWRQHKLTANDILKLAALPLTELKLNRCYLSAGGFEALHQLPNLSSLALGGCPSFDRAALTTVAALKRVKRLDLSFTHLSDQDLEQLNRMPPLEYLCLSQCNGITGAGLAKIATLVPLLYEMDLSDCTGIQESDLTPLANLDHLGILILDQNVSLTGDHLVYLICEKGGFAKLNTLKMSFCPQLNHACLLRLGKKRFTHSSNLFYDYVFKR